MERDAGGGRPAGGDDDGDDHEPGGGRDPDSYGGVPAAPAGEGAAEEAGGHALDAAPRQHRAQIPGGSLHGSPSGAIPAAAGGALDRKIPASR